MMVVGVCRELLTEVYGIDKDRLYATYFEGDEKQGGGTHVPN